MEEEYSRRQQKRPGSASKFTISIVILLLFINTFALSTLLYLNVQANSKQEEQLNNIEKQVSSLDQVQETTDHLTTDDSTEQNVPVKESSTQLSSTIESSSSVESSTQQSQTTTPSSEVTERSTEPASTQTATSYTVQSGDTLSVIAEKNKISLQDLMQKNNLTDSTVYIGQVLSLQ